jgi:hypothetical protein
VVGYLKKSDRSSYMIMIIMIFILFHDKESKITHNYIENFICDSPNFASSVSGR